MWFNIVTFIHVETENEKRLAGLDLDRVSMPCNVDIRDVVLFCVVYIIFDIYFQYKVQSTLYKQYIIITHLYFYLIDQKFYFHGQMFER